MKRILAVIMTLCVLMSLCACAANTITTNDTEEPTVFKMTTAFAAEQSVEDAINEWMSTRFLTFECTEFKYNITKTERSTRSFSGDSETGMMWYNAYGTVTFFNDYGDVLATGDFQVFFGHNGVDSTAYIAEDTVVNVR